LPLTDNVALVSLTTEVSSKEVMRVAAAVQKQVTRDFTPLWGLRATVDAFADLDDVPSDYHPVVLFGELEELIGGLERVVGAGSQDELVAQFERGRLGGIHLNAFTRQPFALVLASDAWPATVSHEILEMVADPYGNRLIAATHPTDADIRVKYLLEVCDPCLGIWYPVNGVQVSDFFTPRYFDPVHNPAAFYSFTGAIRYPLQILEGGYLTWIDPRDSALYQLRGGESEPEQLADLATLASTSSPLRTVVDTDPRTPQMNREALRPADSAPAALGASEAVRAASEGAALRTMQAVWSLATEADSWE
jgi:hypothetical protein